MNLAEIKAAVDRGYKVFWGNKGYQVIKDNIGEYLIVYLPTGDAIGLTHRDGQTLNGQPEEFFL